MADIQSTITHPIVAIPAQAASIGAIIGTIAGWLPGLLGILAALVGTTFYAVMLYESKTVQTWLKGRDYVKLKARQATAARVLLRSQAATARAMREAQEADAAALKAAQEQVTDAAAIVASPVAAAPPSA